MQNLPKSKEGKSIDDVGMCRTRKEESGGDEHKDGTFRNLNFIESRGQRNGIGNLNFMMEENGGDERDASNVVDGTGEGPLSSLNYREEENTKGRDGNWKREIVSDKLNGVHIDDVGTSEA